MEKKPFLYVVGGIVMGVAMSLMFWMLMNLSGGESQRDPQEELVMFENPKKEIQATEFVVRQVIPNGDALAIIREGVDYFSVVLFRGTEESAYYDGQTIEVPRGKKVMQVGTFRYTTTSDYVKTVPVVQIVNRK